MNNNNEETNIDELDEQIRAAHARALNSGEGLLVDDVQEQVNVESGSTDRAAERAKRNAERDAAKVEKRRAKDAARAEKEQNRRPPHLAKVEKAISKLPQLSPQLQFLFDGITTSGASAVDLNLLAEHLRAFVRMEQTKAAIENNDNLLVGNNVVVVGGDPKFIGRTGTIVAMRKIRCNVKLGNDDRELYLFRSEVRLTSDAESVVIDDNFSTEPVSALG
jgi:hypothetical protein